MKLIKPVLFPISVDLMEIFRIIGNNQADEIDILENYNYQQQHYKLINDYVDPRLIKNFFREVLNPLQELKINDHLNGLLLQIVSSKSVYSDYYLYFICDYINDTENYNVDDFLHFGMWLKQKHDFTYKKHAKVNYITSIDGYYNTIVIPKMWRNVSIGNMFNRMYKLPPNYFDQFDTLKKAAKHLIEGGKIYLLNKQDYSWVLHCLGDDFEEVEAYVFQKKMSPKPKSKTKIKLWL